MNPTGLLISLCEMNYKLAWDYFDAGTRRDVETIVAIHRDLEIVDRLMSDSVPPGKIDSAYDKLFTKYHIPDFPLRLYPPYESTSDEKFCEFKNAVLAKYPDW